MSSHSVSSKVRVCKYVACESELVLTLLIEVVEGHTHKIIVLSDIELACRKYRQIIGWVINLKNTH